MGFGTAYIRYVFRELHFSADNLRIQLENKGPRFVFADGDQEDEMIENNLKNENQFTELTGPESLRMKVRKNLCWKKVIQQDINHFTTLLKIVKGNPTLPSV